MVKKEKENWGGGKRALMEGLPKGKVWATCMEHSTKLSSSVLENWVRAGREWGGKQKVNCGGFKQIRSKATWLQVWAWKKGSG